VPSGLTGEFTAVLDYKTDPFEVTRKKVPFTIN
jgi:hypothetical protein